MTILHGYQDTRNNSVDFALTPFLFLVYKNGFAYGLGLCWGYGAYFIAFSPKSKLKTNGEKERIVNMSDYLKGK